MATIINIAVAAEVDLFLDLSFTWFKKKKDSKMEIMYKNTHLDIQYTLTHIYFTKQKRKVTRI